MTLSSTISPLLEVGPLNYKGIMKIELIGKIPINETQLN